jgi:hypothetical protein
MPSSYTHTLRITFAHDGPKLEITNVQRVAMRAPAALPPAGDNQAGYWLEVRDSKGALLYHRPIHDPLRQHVESFGEAAGAPTQRLADAGDRGEFEVLVPDLPDAQTFRLHGPTLAPAGIGTAAAAARLASPGGTLSAHSFDELRARAGQGG